MKKNLCLLYGIAFLQGMVFYSPAAVLYRQEAGLTVFQISVIESLSLLLCLLLEIPWGIVADKIGYRSTMILCCGFYFISKLIFWKAYTFSDFLLERVFLSFAVSGLSGVDTSLLYLSASPGSSQKAFGIYEGMGTAGLLSETIQTITVLLNQPQYIACGLTPGTIAWLYILSQIFAMISPLSAVPLF